MINLKKIFIKSISPLSKIEEVSRLNLNESLLKQLPQSFQEIVIDVGSGRKNYRKYLRYKEYLTVDIDPQNNPDIIGNLEKLPIKTNSVDLVIATEVLEHVSDPGKAVREMYRILKKSGSCLLSTRFIYPYHPEPTDYYRFTVESLSDLFKGFRNVEIISHGNRLHVVWEIINHTGKLYRLFRPFNPVVAKINFKDNLLPLGFIVVAKK